MSVNPKSRDCIVDTHKDVGGDPKEENKKEVTDSKYKKETGLPVDISTQDTGYEDPNDSLQDSGMETVTRDFIEVEEGDHEHQKNDSDHSNAANKLAMEGDSEIGVSSQNFQDELPNESLQDHGKKAMTRASIVVKEGDHEQQRNDSDHSNAANKLAMGGDSEIGVSSQNFQDELPNESLQGNGMKAGTRVFIEEDREGRLHNKDGHNQTRNQMVKGSGSIRDKGGNIGLADSDKPFVERNQNTKPVFTDDLSNCGGATLEIKSSEIKHVERDKELRQEQKKKQEALAKLRGKTTHDDYGEDNNPVYDKNTLKKMLKEAEKKYTYFWKSYSVFSQWHKSKFEVDGTKFTCAEQYMMYQKATLFHSDRIANEILKADSPRRMKALGRQVEQFKDNTWIWHCLNVVKNASLAKFTQNPNLKQELFSTYPTVLVEASPLDKIWGIGLDKDDQRAWDESNWQGFNLLGYILTEVRDELMCKDKIIKDKYRRIFLPELQEKLFENNVNTCPGTYID